MKIKFFLSILILLIIISCGSSNGKMKKFNNLEIYYTQEINIKHVNDLGVFFKENNIIHPTLTHSIKLTSNSESFILKMILNSDLDSIPANKLNDIVFLERAIDTTVFKNLNFAIEITDAYFNPLILN